MMYIDDYNGSAQLGTEGAPATSSETTLAPSSECFETDEAIVLAEFLHHLDHLDLPIPQKLLLLEAISGIMRSFVDQAFGLDETQLALGAQENGANSHQNLIELGRSPTTEFKRIQRSGD